MSSISEVHGGWRSLPQDLPRGASALIAMWITSFDVLLPHQCQPDGRGVEPADVAFYFCHWLTDLAGAEPYPQELPPALAGQRLGSVQSGFAFIIA